MAFFDVQVLDTSISLLVINILGRNEQKRRSDRSAQPWQANAEAQQGRNLNGQDVILAHKGILQTAQELDLPPKELFRPPRNRIYRLRNDSDPPRNQIYRLRKHSDPPGTFAYCYRFITWTKHTMALTTSIENFLRTAQVAINNTLSTPEILAIVSEFGYTEAELTKGQKLYDAALAAQQAQQKEYSEQKSSTDQAETLRNQLHEEYMVHLKLARIALDKQPALGQQLALNGRRKQTFAGWLMQVEQFYTNSLNTPGVLEALDRFKLTPEKLAATQAKLPELIAAKDQNEKEKSEAQRATQLRDEAIDALDEWLSDYIAVARIALAQDPQRLEALGIVAPSP